MLAKTHVNIGFLVSALIKTPLPAGPTAITLIVFNLVPAMLRYLLLAVMVAICVLVPEKGGMFLIPLAVMIGSLLPDIDHPSSTLSQMIAPTGIVIRLLVVAAGSIIVWQGWGTYWIMAVGGVLAIVGLLNIKVLPMELLQRFLLIITGVVLIAWASTPVVSGLGVLYFIMGIISHRGLTHSPEGAILAIIGAWWFTTNIGHPELLIPFAIGYIMHLLADLIADSGIYLSYFAKVKISIPIVKTWSLTDQAISYVAMGITVWLCLSHVDILNNFLSNINSLF